MPPVRVCRFSDGGCARYSFILIDNTRHCRCVSCGHEWQIHLGGGNRYSENETDSILNSITGAAFAAMHSGGLRWS